MPLVPSIRYPSIRYRVHQPFWKALARTFTESRLTAPAKPGWSVLGVFGACGASRETLEARAGYAGRKGNSARRRLGVRPSTSVAAFRTQQTTARVLKALTGEEAEMPLYEGYLFDTGNLFSTPIPP